MLFMVLIILIIVCLLGYPFLHDIYLMYIKGFPPGPFSLPLIGNASIMTKNTNWKIQQLGRKYGNVFSLRLGFSQRIVFLLDVDTIKTVLNDKNIADRPPLPFFNIVSNDGHGIGSRPYDKIWSVHTYIIHSTLTKLAKKNMDDYTMKAHQMLFERFDSMNGEPFDAMIHLQNANLCMMSGLIYGKKYLSLDDPHLKTLAWINDATLEGLSMVHPINILPILQYMPWPFFNNLRNIVTKRDEIMKKTLKEHFENYTGEIKDILDGIVGTVTGENISLSLSESQRKTLHIPSLLISVFTLFNAGEFNLTNIYLWMLLYLAKHQDCQAIIYDETKEKTQIMLKDRPEMPYTCKYQQEIPEGSWRPPWNVLFSFLLETLRIVTPNHLGVPRLTSKDVILDGYKIPKGTTIFPHIWNVHHHEKHWKDPYMFKPSRFLETVKKNSSLNDLRSHPFLPFGWGKRRCTGLKVTTDSMFLFLGNMVQRYHVKLSADSDPDMRGKANLTITPYPFKIILTKRQ